MKFEGSKICIYFNVNYFWQKIRNSMIELLRTRRSIRKFTEQKLESEKIEILKEAVLRSPSSKGINPWVFIFGDEKEIIQQLKNCKPHGAGPLETAPLAVVICADETLNDAWIEDCSIASILLQLTAQSLGLGSCWIQIHNRMHSETISSEKFIQDLLDIPAQFKVLSIISIGYPVKWKEGKKLEDLQFEKIRINKY
jgi:nitroreductase